MSMSPETRARLLAMAQRDTQPSSQPYGDVAYADPGYQADKKKRYPIDTEDHVRAAWSYINHPNMAALYTAAQVAEIKGRIMAAGKKFGVQFAASDHSPRGAADDAEWRDWRTRT